MRDPYVAERAVTHQIAHITFIMHVCDVFIKVLPVLEILAAYDTNVMPL